MFQLGHLTPQGAYSLMSFCNILWQPRWTVICLFLLRLKIGINSLGDGFIFLRSLLKNNYLYLLSSAKLHLIQMILQLEGCQNLPNLRYHFFTSVWTKKWFLKIVNAAKTHFINWQKGHRCTIYILLIRSII